MSEPPVTEPGRNQIKPLEWLLILVLSFNVILFLNATGDKPGIDFYQYWSVGHVIHLTNGEVRNPYTQQQRFKKILAADAKASNDALYKRAQTIREDLEFQGSPMAYTFFSFAPRLSYTETIQLYFILQTCLFLLAVYKLTRIASGNRAHSILTALVLALAYQPFKTELTVANMNSVVIFGLLLTLWLGNSLARAGPPRLPEHSRSNIVLATALLVVIGAVSMLKPTVALVGLAMCLFLFARFGLARIWPSFPIAALVLGGLAVLPAVRLGSASIWLDWRTYFAQGNLDMFNLPVSQGNYSGALFLSKILAVPLTQVVLSICAILALSLIWVARRSGNMERTFQASFSDPLFSMAVGLAVFYAISPLVWFHYFLLLLIPGLAFFHPRYSAANAWKYMTVAVLVASSLPLHVVWLANPTLFLSHLARPQLITCWLMAGWIVLWCGLLSVVAAYGRNNIAPQADTRVAPQPGAV